MLYYGISIVGGEKMKKLKILLPVFAVLFVVSVFAFSFLSGTEKISNASGFAMGSPVNVTVYGIKDGCPCINDSRLSI